MELIKEVFLTLSITAVLSGGLLIWTAHLLPCLHLPRATLCPGTSPAPRVEVWGSLCIGVAALENL